MRHAHVVTAPYGRKMLITVPIGLFNGNYQKQHYLQNFLEKNLLELI